MVEKLGAKDPAWFVVDGPRVGRRFELTYSGGSGLAVERAAAGLGNPFDKSTKK